MRQNGPGNRGEIGLKTGLFWLGKLAFGSVVLGAASLIWASEVHTNPLNRDPLVREAYDHFYNLDYPGAIERFERFRQAHPGDPQATAMLLDAVTCGSPGCAWRKRSNRSMAPG